jgi:hypothetical protein
LFNTESRSDVLLKRSDGCKLEQFETSRHRGRYGREVVIVQTDGPPYGMTRRSNGWQRTEFSALQTVQNLLEALMNSGIPFKKHLYKEVILSNKMWSITN